MKAAFFDRDGTLIKDAHYLSSLDQVELIPGIIEFCLELQKEYTLIVVTNQSGVGRGYFSEDFVKKTHDFIKDLFATKGVQLEHFYCCPHHPSQNCLCRKPSPGMLFQAAKEHNLDLSQSLMFGDKELDIIAGQKAGCKSFWIEDALRSFHEAK